MSESDSPVAQNDESLFVLEENSRLSESVLWQLQRTYFAQEGLSAWRAGTVPFYITSNPYIARRYAQLVFGWLRDLVNTPGLFDPTLPLYIVELGAGSGQLGYHFVRQFNNLLGSSTLRRITFRYVMTDFNPATLEGWQAQPQLAQLAESGHLDFARFDATVDQSLSLIHSQTQLTAGSLKNPIVVIANYVFDSLPQDVFRFENGQIFESLVRALAHPPEPDLNDPNLLKRVVLAYRHQPTSLPVYAEPDFNEILEFYRQTLQQSCVPFPVASLRCLQVLRQLSNDRLLVISGDKGFHHEEDLDFRDEPGLTIHGSFSMSVNLHALGQYTTKAGGLFLATAHRRLNLDICALVFSGHEGDYLETRQAFVEAIEQGGPDDFFALKKTVEGHYADMDLAEVLALYRMSGWDSAIFAGSLLELPKKLSTAGNDLKLETYRAVQQIWDNFYYLGDDKDVAYALGLVLMAIENYAEAANFFGISLEMHGPDFSTYYYLANCHYETQKLELALTYVRQSLAANADFEPAQTLLTQIQKALP